MDANELIANECFECIILRLNISFKIHIFQTEKITGRG